MRTLFPGKFTVKAEKGYEKSNYQASSRNPASGSRNNKSCLFCQGNYTLFR